MKKNELVRAKILLVEDEDTMAIGLEFNLSEEGYEVIRAADGKKALEYIDSDTYDLVILDIMLPYYDGFEIAEILRQKDPQIPILMLTARGDIKDRIKGFETGADDYLIKPFHLDELLLRVQGMLRRKSWYKETTTRTPVIHFGKNEINFENLTCQAGDKKFQLTPQEALLLRYLIDHKGKIISRQELLKNVWNVKSDIETRTVDNFIAHLRKYFEQDPSHPVYIRSVRGAGYMFSDESS